MDDVSIMAGCGPRVREGAATGRQPRVIRWVRRKDGRCGASRRLLSRRNRTMECIRSRGRQLLLLWGAALLLAGCRGSGNEPGSGGTATAPAGNTEAVGTAERPLSM